MTKNDVLEGETFLTLLSIAKSVLNESPEEIRRKFPENPVQIINYIRQGTPEYMMEIRFEDIKATLSCEFGSEDNCLNAYLLPDSIGIDNIGKYINYLDERYDFEFLKYKWTLPECTLSIKTMKNIYYFMFSWY